MKIVVCHKFKVVSGCGAYALRWRERAHFSGFPILCSHKCHLETGKWLCKHDAEWHRALTSVVAAADSVVATTWPNKVKQFENRQSKIGLTFSALPFFRFFNFFSSSF